MLGSTTKMATMAVALIVVVAGLGIVLLSQGSEAYRSTDTSGRLMVFGNANNDDYLDEDDITTLQMIIDGELDAEDHPFADANQDGVIDEKDIEMVRKMIDREPMDIFYMNAWGEVKSISYPLGDIIVVGTGAMGAVKSIGGADRVLARSGGHTYDPVLFSDVIDRPMVSDSVFRADPELVSNIANVSAIVTQDTTTYVPNEDLFVTAGIPVIRIAATDGLDTIGAIITLGYLLGLEEQANEYARFCDEILTYITSRVGPDVMEDEDRVTSISVTMFNAIGGTESAYYSATQIAGSINLADWSDRTKRFNIGDEWLYSYNPDFIIHARSIGYGEIDVQDAWDTLSIYFTNMPAFENGNYVILNGNMPVIIRIAYMASIFYPDLIGEDYGHIKHQEFIDRFMDNLVDYDVTQDCVSTINCTMVNQDV